MLIDNRDEFRNQLQRSIDFFSETLQIAIPKTEPVDQKAHPLEKILYTCTQQLMDWPPREDSKYVNDVLFLVSFMFDVDLVTSAGWDLDTLKDRSMFHSRSYEIIVGADYIAKGYNVTFPDPPDLIIQTSNGIIHGECKRKQPVSERDIKVSEFWEDLESYILKLMDEQNKFYGITIKSNNDPDENSIERFKDSIADILNRDLTGSFKDDFDNRIFCKRLANPGEKIITDRIDFGTSEPVDRIYFSSLATKTLDEKLEWENPRFLAFKSADQTDRIKTVLNSVDKAINSLRTAKKYEVPSVAHIEIHKHGTDLNHGEYLRALLPGIAKKLTKRKNTRLNRVVVTWMEPVFRDGKLIAIQRNKREVNHPNPKHPLPNRFESYSGATIVLKKSLPT